MDLTILIKTFKRKDILFNECLRSIRKYYPDIPVFILNDDNETLTTNLNNTMIINTEFNIGLSEGRNRLIKEVKTKYFLLLDDDSIFTEETKLEKFYDILENTNFAIIGGVVDDDRKPFWLIEEKGNGKVLFEKEKSYGLLKKYNCQRCDAVKNFFMGNTKKFIDNNIQWDPELKVGEHNLFFYNVFKNHSKEIKIGFTPDVKIIQSKNRKTNKEYMRFRIKARELLEKALPRYNIKYLKCLTGLIIKSYK